MNQFRMRLLPRYFDELEKGTKYIEIRCNDEKRQKIKPGDLIVFENTETGKLIEVEVVKLERYTSFEKLIRSYPVEAFGFHGTSVEDVVSTVDHIYSHDQEKKWGALGIILNTKKMIAVGG